MTTATANTAPQTNPHGSLYEQVCEVYKLYRILRMNVLYYGRSLQVAQQWNIGLDIAVAITSSGTFASISILKPCLPWFAATTAILTILKTTLAFPKQIEKQTTLWSGFLGMSLEVYRIIEQIQLKRDITGNAN